MLDINVDKLLDISYGKSGEKEKESSPYYIGPVSQATPAPGVESGVAVVKELPEVVSAVPSGYPGEQLGVSLGVPAVASPEGHGKDSSGKPSGDTAGSSTKAPAESAGGPEAGGNADGTPASETAVKRKKKSAVRTDKTISIQEDVYQLLLYEKARLSRSGRDVSSFGALIKESLTKGLKRSDRQVYDFYKSIGLVD